VAHLITFSTDRFDVSSETPNPINPIAGEGLLKWIRGKLAGTLYTATVPEAEDWGWYMDVEGGGSSYLVGASGEPEPPGANIDWTIQVHKHRSLRDRLTGKNKTASDDPLFVLLEGFVRGESDFRDVSVATNA
jgi:hypothetical protein